jgi:hypothetical protein
MAAATPKEKGRWRDEFRPGRLLEVTPTTGRTPARNAVIKFGEEVGAPGANLRERADALLRVILAALPARTGGAAEPFDRSTGDDWVGDVGPAMAWQDHEEYEEVKYGTPARGVTLRYVHEYYALHGKGERNTQSHSARIECHGRGEGVELSARISAFRGSDTAKVSVYWVLPDDEHAALLAAWEAFKAERGAAAR